MPEKVNLAAKLATFDDHWQPRIVDMLNDYKVIVVKVQGEFVWHKHDETDEEAWVLLIEPEATVNTGDAGGPLTTEAQWA